MCAPAFTIPWSIRTCVCDWGQSQFSSHVFSELQPLCRLTMETAIVFLQHLPRALILCSGTSYSLCMFACSSAFDGPLGLIQAMQSLSQLGHVSLGGASARKTAAGKNGWRKESFRISGGVCDFWLRRVPLCVALCRVPLRVRSAKIQSNVDWAQTDNIQYQLKHQLGSQLMLPVFISLISSRPPAASPVEMSCWPSGALEYLPSEPASTCSEHH